ncbi:MAG: HEAT repeat domain-containing protein [Methylacidiphilales bacterium]|nr:HEAT repeat domain-containing protein [Candidatus Methylacidiphilales bacterium]
MAALMKKCFWRLALVAVTMAGLAGCSNKETREALEKASSLEEQKQYQSANEVLVEALRARETQLRSQIPAPSDQAAADGALKKVEADPEILKLERAQIIIYLQMERADLASAVFDDILKGSPNDTVITDLLTNSDPLVRGGAVRVLGLTGKATFIPALTTATKDSDKNVRRAAVAALGGIKDPSTVPPLIDALKDSYWFVRSDAAEALRGERDPRALKPLLDAMSDSDSSVQNAAEGALVTICATPGANVSTDDLASHLNNPNQKVVMISAICLAVLKDPRAVPVLLNAVSSPDLDTRLQAIKGLGETGDPSVIPTLRETLKDPDVNIRGWSIIGLGNLKDQQSVPDLKNIAADSSQSPRIRSAAEAAIENITGQSATPSDAGSQ